MSSTKHELSRLEHVCPELDLSLVSTCSLKVSSVKSFPFDVSRSDQLFESFVTAGAWITRSNGVRLSVRLLGQDSCVSPADGFASMELQATIIRHLEVAILSVSFPALC
jgi:hypothetical protein